MAVRLDIFEAAKRGDAKRMRQLIEIENADPNKRDQDGATCLMFAAMRGHVAVVELLLANKADVDLQDAISGWTALMQATFVSLLTPRTGLLAVADPLRQILRA